MYSIHVLYLPRERLPYRQQPEVNYSARFSLRLISLERWPCEGHHSREIDLFENLDIVHIRLLVVAGALHAHLTVKIFDLAVITFDHQRSRRLTIRQSGRNCEDAGTQPAYFAIVSFSFLVASIYEKRFTTDGLRLHRLFYHPTLGSRVVRKKKKGRALVLPLKQSLHGGASRPDSMCAMLPEKFDSSWFQRQLMVPCNHQMPLST